MVQPWKTLKPCFLPEGMDEQTLMFADIEWKLLAQYVLPDKNDAGG